MTRAKKAKKTTKPAARKAPPAKPKAKPRPKPKAKPKRRSTMTDANNQQPAPDTPMSTPTANQAAAGSGGPVAQVTPTASGPVTTLGPATPDASSGSPGSPTAQVTPTAGGPVVTRTDMPLQSGQKGEAPPPPPPYSSALVDMYTPPQPDENTPRSYPVAAGPHGPQHVTGIKTADQLKAELENLSPKEKQEMAQRSTGAGPTGSTLDPTGAKERAAGKKGKNYDPKTDSEVDKKTGETSDEAATDDDDDEDTKPAKKKK